MDAIAFPPIRHAIRVWRGSGSALMHVKEAGDPRGARTGGMERRLPGCRKIPHRRHERVAAMK
jgi:hypothetical protein